MADAAKIVHKPGQGVLQLGRFQLLTQKLPGPSAAGACLRLQAGPPPYNWRLHWGVGKKLGTKYNIPRNIMPPKSRATRNISAVPSQAESRPTTHSQQQVNQAEGANGTGAGPQPPPRNPADNTNTFIEMLQSLQHSQQQMMEEIR